jgi:hypothetical protein
MLDQLAGRKTRVLSVVALPLPSESGNYAASVKSVCNLAHDAGANYVFLFGGTVDSWRKNNPLSVLDITLVGGAILPGSEINVEAGAPGH